MCLEYGVGGAFRKAKKGGPPMDKSDTGQRGEGAATYGHRGEGEFHCARHMRITRARHSLHVDSGLVFFRSFVRDTSESHARHSLHVDSGLVFFHSIVRDTCESHARHSLHVDSGLVFFRSIVRDTSESH